MAGRSGQARAASQAGTATAGIAQIAIWSKHSIAKRTLRLAVPQRAPASW